MLGEFADWARDQRDDLVNLLNDIELERFGPSEADILADIHSRITSLVEDSIQMVEVAVTHDELMEDELDNSEAGQTFHTRISLIIRELQWSDPDGFTLHNLEDAVRGFADEEVVVFA